MEYKLNGSPKGFPVFVVYNELEVFGVFVSREKAEDCAHSHLDFQLQVSIQLCYIEDINVIDYKIN